MQFEVQWHVLVKSWVLCGFMADVVLHAANWSVFHLEIVLSSVIDKSLSIRLLQLLSLHLCTLHYRDSFRAEICISYVIVCWFNE